jgi:hypothetical protein
MTERGFERGKIHGTRTYEGISLLADGVQKEIAVGS